MQYARPQAPLKTPIQVDSSLLELGSMVRPVFFVLFYFTCKLETGTHGRETCSVLDISILFRVLAQDTKSVIHIEFIHRVYFSPISDCLGLVSMLFPFVSLYPSFPISHLFLSLFNCFLGSDPKEVNDLCFHKYLKAQIPVLRPKS